MNKKVSILITAYQRLDFIKNLVHSLIRCTKYPDCEIIVANTCPGYNPHLDKYLDVLPKTGLGLKMVNTNKPLQFMEGIEEAYKQSTGDYILLINDDMLVSHTQPQWVTSMVNFLDTHEDYGSVSIYQYLDGARLYTLGETDIDKPGHTCGRYRNTLNELPPLKDTLWNNFSCVMMRRQFIEGNRFLDVVPEEQYHYGSDSCYCKRIIENGLKNGLINDAWIFHFNNRYFKGRVGQYSYNGV